MTVDRATHWRDKARPAEGAAVLLLVVATVLVGMFKIADPDFFWHLKVGQIILEQRSLIHVNTLSGAFADYRWHNPEWLFQVILAAAYESGGWAGVALLKSLVTTALSLTVYGTARWLGAGRVAALALALVVISQGRFRLTERPHLLSLLFLALTALLAERYRREGTKTSACGILALVALWSNIHPELIFGLIYLCILSLGDLLLVRWGWSGASQRGKGLLLISVGATGTALLNPEGYRTLTYGWEHRFYHSVVDIKEFTSAPLSAHPIFYALAGSLLLLAVLYRKKTDIPLLATATLFFALGVTYRRMIPAFTVVASLCLAKIVAGEIAVRKRAIFSAFLVLQALSSTAWCLKWDSAYPYRFGYGMLEELLPAEAADFLQREKLPQNLYNDFEVGGYLAFRLFPGYTVFQDGRIPAYPVEFLTAVHRSHVGTNWPELLARLNVNSALFELPLLNVLFRENEWAVVYWDSRYVVAVRRTAADRDLLDRLEYRYYKPFTGYDASPSSSSFRRLEFEITRNIRERRTPPWRPLCDLAHLKSSVGKKKEAISLLVEAEKVVPEKAESLRTLADEWLFTGDTERAKAVLARSRAVPLQGPK